MLEEKQLNRKMTDTWKRLRKPPYLKYSEGSGLGAHLTKSFYVERGGHFSEASNYNNIQFLNYLVYKYISPYLNFYQKYTTLCKSENRRRKPMM